MTALLDLHGLWWPLAASVLSLLVAWLIFDDLRGE